LITLCQSRSDTNLSLQITQLVESSFINVSAIEGDLQHAGVVLPLELK